MVLKIYNLYMYRNFISAISNNFFLRLCKIKVKSLFKLKFCRILNTELRVKS